MEEMGTHYDVDFIQTVWTRLKTFRRDLIPKALKKTLKSHAENHHVCDCQSLDSNHTDTDDHTWCPHSRDERTYVILDRLLPYLRNAASELNTLVDDIEARAATSRNNHAVNVGRVEAWRNNSAMLDAQRPVESLHYQTAPRRHAYPKGISRLSPETLVSIFLHARQQSPSTMLLLGQVNKAFRHVTLYTPLLWAQINVLQSPNMVTFHLERSAGVPLDVSLSIPPMYPTSIPPTPSANEGTTRLSRFIARLALHYHRIGRLEALQPYPTWVRMCLDFVLFNNLPNMKVVHIGWSTIPNEFQTEKAELEPDRDAAIPLELTTVSLLHIRVRGHCSFFSASTTTLRLRHSVFPTIGSLVFALQAMPNLTSIHIEDLLFDSGHIAWPGTPMVLTKLHELRISHNTMVDGMVATMAAFHMPSLRTLCVHNYGHPVLPDTQFPEGQGIHLLDMIRGNEKLKQLELADVCLADEDWKSVFGSLPVLTSLKTRRCNLPGDLLPELFGPPLGGMVACPKLRHLSLDTEMDISSGEVRSALVARAQRDDAASLKSLVLRRWLASKIDCDDLEVIRQHVGFLAIDVMVDVSLADDDVVEDDRPSTATMSTSSSDHDTSNSSSDAENSDEEADEDEENEEEVDDDEGENESVYSDSCSDGSWTSGDEMVVENRLPHQLDV